MKFDCNSDESSCSAEGVHMRAHAYILRHFLKLRSVFEALRGQGAVGM